MQLIGKAIQEWQTIVGKKYLLEHDGNVIIKPANKTEIIKCIYVARRYKIPLHPISRGKNWGYQGNTTKTMPYVVLCLQRLNSIIDYSPSLGTVTLQTGVTFKQLETFLKTKRSNFMMTVTGAPTSASVVGSILERGIGKGLYGDRHQHVGNAEIILPDGSIINTGFERYPTTIYKNVSATAPGPSIFGLFTQSTFGIVISITILLQKRPSRYQIVHFFFNNPKKLIPFSYAIRDLKMKHILQGNFLLMNDYKRIALIQQYPWKLTQNTTPLTQSKLDDIKKKWPWGGTWTGQFALFSESKKHEEALQAITRDTLSPLVDTIVFITKTRLKQMSKLSHFDIVESQIVIELEKQYNTNSFLGILPQKTSVNLYWRKKMLIPKTADPVRDKCGLQWLNVVLPLGGSHITTAVTIIKKCFLQHSFEPNIGINYISDRTVYIIAAIIYDQEIEGEDKKARICHRYTQNKLMQNGYYPYRLGRQSANNLLSTRDDTMNTIKKIKKALDPDSIMAS